LVAGEVVSVSFDPILFAGAEASRTAQLTRLTFTQKEVNPDHFDIS
jgi:hypothetical protein